MRRIVVTGMGAVTPLGSGVGGSWERLLAGQSGLRRLPDAVAGTLPLRHRRASGATGRPFAPLRACGCVRHEPAQAGRALKRER